MVGHIDKYFVFRKLLGFQIIVIYIISSRILLWNRVEYLWIKYEDLLCVFCWFSVEIGIYPYFITFPTFVLYQESPFLPEQPTPITSRVPCPYSFKTYKRSMVPVYLRKTMLKTPEAIDFEISCAKGQR